jgi:RNA polymerase sigma-70 factor, ECF subfamily
LGRMLAELLPGQPEAQGLLALMLLHDARRATRLDGGGELVMLEAQDRARWDKAQIEEGAALVESALKAAGRAAGPYGLQAAIAAVHAEAKSPEETDWTEIVGLYDVLLRAETTPVIELNRAAAVAMRDGAAAGLALVDAILARGDLLEYPPAHSARAELCRRLGRTSDALESYERALQLTRQEPQRRFLERRIRELA